MEGDGGGDWIELAWLMRSGSCFSGDSSILERPIEEAVVVAVDDDEEVFVGVVVVVPEFPSTAETVVEC
jgi:hypothetical protein